MTKKIGPDPKLKYDIEWYEGKDNPHAEFNKQRRLEEEAMAAKKKVLLKQKIAIGDLTHEQWEVLVSDGHYTKEMKRLAEVAAMFSQYGYDRVYKGGAICDLFVLKKGVKNIQAVIVTSGEQENPTLKSTIYPGIQLTKTVVKSFVEGDEIYYEDCKEGIICDDGDSCFVGKTLRWGFDCKKLKLSDFINSFIKNF